MKYRLVIARSDSDAAILTTTHKDCRGLRPRNDLNLGYNHPMADFLTLPLPLVIDGGMASSLEEQGITLDPKLWSGSAVIEQPEAVETVHNRFASAGAQIHITASYQLSAWALEARKVGQEERKKIFLRSVECAQKALKHSPHKNLIAASCGPYGAYLADGSEYRGDYQVGVEEIRKFHQERFDVFSASEADLILFETLPCLKEVEAIRELASHSSKPLWLSFFCQNGKELASGESIEQAAKMAYQIPGLVAVGVNCVAPHFVSTQIKYLKAQTDKKIFVYPNLGKTWNAVSKTWEGPGEETVFLGLVEEWMKLGVDGIGGCCGVTAPLIHKITQSLRGKAEAIPC